MNAQALRTGVSLAVLSALAGCQSAEDKLFGGERLAKSHYDAASTHVAVLSVAPWADVVDSLQPGFQLTGEEALLKTLPMTQLLSTQLLNAQSASLQVSLPTITQTRNETVTRDQSGTTPSAETRRVEEQQQSGPGQPPALPPEAAGGRRARDLPGLPLDPNRLKRDALLEYQTATALFQEVQVLNNYVKSAARRTGYTPYLMRLQVTVLPNARNQPYDVFADISFMPPLPKGKVPGDPGSRAETIPHKPDKVEDPQEIEDPQASKGPRVPLVVPLLVTDNLEVSLQSRAIEILRQLQGAVGGQFQNVGVNAAVGLTKDDIASALGGDLNAISTVGLLNDNTARVRLGAMSQASTRYAMVPRANTITFLVLVPGKDVLGYDPATLPIFLNTSLRHAKSGAFLPEVDASNRRRRERDVANIAEHFGIQDNPPGEAKKFVEALSDSVIDADYARFVDTVQEATGGDVFDALWNDVSQLPAGEGHSSAMVEIPSATKTVLPAKGTLALLLDDKKTRATTRLSGASGFSADQVQAELLLGSSSNLGGSTRDSLAAVAVARIGSDLILTFDSPAVWSLAKAPQVKGDPSLPPGSQIKVVLAGKRADAQRGCADAEDPREIKEPCSGVYNVRYLARSAEPDPVFSITTTVQTVAIDDKGLGTYTFGLTMPNKEKVNLIGDGVAIAKVEPASLAKDGVTWAIAKPGRVTVTLEQLTPGQAFKLKLTDSAKIERAIELNAKVKSDKTEKK